MQTPLNLVVTAGPTIEPLDQVRRLTNFSTARLGSELAAFLSHQGHQVILLRGQASTWPVPKEEIVLRDFTTTAHLAERLQDCVSASVDAVFHAAAVSDFQFG
ncbi:MAG: phosphopantothenoylcysteine decarboxylase, partial [Verrucomicrobiota bacterium]